MKRGERMILFIVCLCCLRCPELTAQEPDQIREQVMENLAENSGAELMDDHHLQLLEQYRRQPLQLNTAQEGELQELMLLSPLQIRQFLQYRQVMGPLISLYELQAVPGWDLAVIDLIRPYITVTHIPEFISDLAASLKNGDHLLLLRAGQTFRNTVTSRPAWLGSLLRAQIRYRYRYKNQLQYGILAEKDAGEQWWGGSQPRGFGFYSAHFFIRRRGFVQTIALGDFTVNMGQGLLIWQSIAFRKGADVLQIRRQSPVLRPYHAAGEFNFHRGLGLSLGKGPWKFTGFASLRLLDGNRVTDTGTGQQFVSSLSNTGLHRTPAELDDRGAQRQWCTGAALAFNRAGLHLGLHTLHYHFALPFRKQALPYNLYAISGRSLTLTGADFHYTFRNLHVFGELALGERKQPAYLAGGLISLAAVIDFSWIYRNLPPGFQSLQGNAFTENTLPSNENGLYTGISIRPAPAWRIDAYADGYRFPWLRYLVNAPGRGMDYLLLLQYKPNKLLETTLRFRMESRDQRVPEMETETMQVIRPFQRKQVRWQMQYRVSASSIVRCRADWIRVRQESGLPEEGLLLYADLQYAVPLSRWSFATRLQYFETGGYNSRLYAYEKDVLFSFSIPAFYGRGVRYYLMGKFTVASHITCWVRYARTHYLQDGPRQVTPERGAPADCNLQLQFRF